MAEDRTRNHFETRTFVADELRDLSDGETTTIEDEFAGGINFGRPRGADALQYAGKIVRDALEMARDIPGYLALRKTSVESRGKWDVTRRGNDFIFRGNVDHSLRDRFDFDEGQPGRAEAEVLEKSGGARPFTMRHEFSEPSSAASELRPDGRFRLKSARWGDERPPRSRSLADPFHHFLGP